MVGQESSTSKIVDSEMPAGTSMSSSTDRWQELMKITPPRPTKWFSGPADPLLPNNHLSISISSHKISIVDISVESVVHHVLASSAELLVSLDHLVNSLNQVLFGYCFAPVPDSEHPGLSADRPQLCSCGVGAQTTQQLVTDALLNRHRLCMDPEDVDSPL